MNTLVTKNKTQIQQHQAIHAHMKYLINAIGRLDIHSCLHIADSNSLKNRITLYRWSLADFKEAIQRDAELHKRIFLGDNLPKDISRENQEVLEKITDTITLAEDAFNRKILREELNVILVKINLAVNTICESIKLNMTREEELVKKP
jgi:hypothetical protein